MLLWGDGYGNDMSFNVAAGATSGIDLDVTGDFGDNASATNNLNKNGAGVMRLTGDNTYRGATTVNAGTLIVGDGTSGSILVDINDADNTQLLGSGTLTLNGTINLDVTEVTGPGSWSVVDVDSLSETYDTNFAIGMWGGSLFTELCDVWTYTDGAMEWKFTESTGVLEYAAAVPEPGTLALLATGLIGLLACVWRKR